MDVIYRYDPFTPIETRQVPDAKAALKILVDGNDRFAEMVRRMQEQTLGHGNNEPIVTHINPISLGLPLYPGAMPIQSPFAVVLGCSDARVPTEAIFDQFCNDLFVLRIAGNVLGAECLGSLHYAVKHLKDSLKLIVVIGHSKCGAVTAAVDNFLSPQDYLDIAYTYPLRSLVDQIQIAVRGAARALDQYMGVATHDKGMYRSLMVAIAVYLNAAVSALELKRELALRKEDGVGVVFGVYDFDTLRVQSCPGPLGAAPRLRPALKTTDDLVKYAREVIDGLMSMPDDEREASCMLTMRA